MEGNSSYKTEIYFVIIKLEYLSLEACEACES